MRIDFQFWSTFLPLLSKIDKIYLLCNFSRIERMHKMKCSHPKCLVLPKYFLSIKLWRVPVLMLSHDFHHSPTIPNHGCIMLFSHGCPLYCLWFYGIQTSLQFWHHQLNVNSRYCTSAQGGLIMSVMTENYHIILQYMWPIN